MQIFKYLKTIFLSIFCTCEDTESTVYYKEMLDGCPCIKVYREDICKNCGSCSTILLAEYIHDLRHVKQELEAKGVPSAIDISRSYVEEEWVVGLDQYAYRVKRQNVISDLSFKQGRLLSDGVTDEFGNDIGFDYWRKFFPLNSWAYKLYVKKGGKGEFNCVNLKLGKEDLDELYALAQTDEFYQNGYYRDAKKERKLEYDHLMKFIENAKTVISEGDAIYYSNWE